MQTGRFNIFIQASLIAFGLFVLPSFAFAAVVNAGPDKTVTWPSSVTMSGSTDQALSGTAWTKKGGPSSGNVTFSPSQGSATPSVSFSEPGVYTLEYCAVFVACDQTTVTVNLPTPSLTFDTTRPDCGTQVYTGVTNGGPNAAIHYDWTNSQGAWYNFDENLNGRQTNSSGSMIDGPFPSAGGMTVAAGWQKGGVYSVRVRTKKNGMVSSWSSSKSFTFCSTPTLQIRQGSGAWFSGSGVVFNCGSPLYTRIANAPSNVRMFFRWTSSQGVFYESTQFDAGKNPATDSGGSVTSGPFPDSGGPTIAGGWRDGGIYTIEVWSPGGSNNDTQAFTLQCSSPPPPPSCPGGAAKTCTGAQQNQYRCTTGLGREQCLSTSGQWCWEAASSCSAGQSCSNGSCTSTPPPPPPPGPSCNPRTFVRSQSGFYNLAGASITSIPINTPFDILCNYTVGTDDTGIIPVTAGAPNCGWIDFVGNSARFRCEIGISTPGVYTYECKVGGNTPPATANSCYQDNPIGSITVTGGTPPPPPPPPPPAGCSNTWNSSTGGTYDRDGSATRCGCDSWDQCGNYNGAFSPSPDPWCSPRPGGCAPPPPPPAPLACSSVSVSATEVYGPSATYDVIVYGVTGASNVRVPHWTELNGQNDVGGWPWPAATNQGGGTWRYTVNLSNHLAGNPEYGRVINHVYLNDSAYFCGEAIVNWAESLPRPDLVITNHWTTPAPIDEGDVVDFHAIVRNQGTSASGATQTNLCLDTNSSTISTCDFTANRNTNLAPSTSEQEDWLAAWTAVAGTHTYRVCADSALSVTESNESNNCVTSTFTVGTTPPPPPPAPEPCTHNVYPANRFHVCYFDGTGAPTGNDPVLRQRDEPRIAADAAVVGAVPAAIDRDWGSGAVGGTTKTNMVSAVWRGDINLQPGVYTFHVASDDGVRFGVEINGTMQNVINSWQDQNAADIASAPITLPGGPTQMRLRWYENGGNARIKLWWTFSPVVGPPPPPCDVVGAACCGNTCTNGLVCDEDLNVCINPPSGLPTVTLRAPAEGATVNATSSVVLFGGDSVPVMPVRFRWKFNDTAPGAIQKEYQLFVLDITDEFPVDSDSDSGCVVDGEYAISPGCLFETIDFSNTQGNDPNNGKKITSASETRTVNLHTQHIYAWTVIARSSVDDPTQPVGTIFAERRSEINDTGFRVFDTGTGILGGGSIEVERIDRHGDTLPSADFNLSTSAWRIGTFPIDDNPASFLGLDDLQEYIVYVNDQRGFTERVRQCSPSGGGCSVEDFETPADKMNCNGSTCFVEEVPVDEGVVTKLVVMYIPECSDGLDNDDADTDIDEEDAGCKDGDGNYDPDDTDESDDPVGPGGDFTITHNPYPASGPHIQHQIRDIQVARQGDTSTVTRLTINPVGGFDDDVTLSVIGIAHDDLPADQDDGIDDDSEPDDGDGIPDDSFDTSFNDWLVPRFGSGSGTVTKTLTKANYSTDFKIRTFPAIPTGRYIVRVQGSSPIGNRISDIIFVVGSQTSGYYTPR